ncbi:hypothetical protein [Rhizobium leguminosarum]|uniref:hypothetical protein n=1 Tax=Rhizobium leguminosarum TaxID=384 RepID=UPI0021B12A14|nr:hypothetical protein [Rhizobium leguminosarum]
MQQLLRKMNAPGLRNGNWRRAKMLAKEPAQLSLADPDPFGERGDVSFVVEGAILDEGERSVDRIG